jgi:hypothetical protein
MFIESTSLSKYYEIPYEGKEPFGAVSAEMAA